MTKSINQSTAPEVATSHRREVASNLFSRNQEPVDPPDCPTRPHNLSHNATSNTDTPRPEALDGQNATQTGEILRPPSETPPCRNLEGSPESHQLFSGTTTSRELSSYQASKEPNIGTQNQSLLGSRLPNSSTVQEAYQDTPPVEPFTQKEEQFPPHAANTPSADSPRSIENLTVAIAYEIQDGVIRLLPTTEEWRDFPTLLQYARNLGAEKSGICKVLLPEGVPSRRTSTPSNTAEQRGYRFLSHPQGNGTFEIERAEVDVLLQLESGLLESSTNNPSSAQELVRRFEQPLESNNGLEGVTYCTDIDVRTEASRARMGLPNECPIWPLDGDHLCDTKIAVPGIHWPYAYQSGDSFGAPFTMHIEGYWLISINYLYTGEKIWVTVAPEHVHLLEQKLRATNSSLYPSNCEQFLRHSATYFSRRTLDEWGVSYSLVHEKSYEVVVTFPRAYHEGFSAGHTFAVAITYADANWNFDSYRDCWTQSCPAGFIKRKMMCSRRKDEEQQEQEEEMEEEDEDREEDDEERNDEYNNTDSDSRDNMTAKRPVKRGSTRKGTRLRQRADAVSSKPSSKGLKRKSTEQRPGIENSKRFKKRLLFDASSPISFNELERIPQDIIPPAEVYQRFIDRSKSEDGNLMWLLTRLLFAIASPDAFYNCGMPALLSERKGNLLSVSPRILLLRLLKRLIDWILLFP